MVARKRRSSGYRPAISAASSGVSSAPVTAQPYSSSSARTVGQSTASTRSGQEAVRGSRVRSGWILIPSKRGTARECEVPAEQIWRPRPDLNRQHDHRYRLDGGAWRESALCGRSALSSRHIQALSDCYVTTCERSTDRLVPVPADQLRGRQLHPHRGQPAG